MSKDNDSSMFIGVVFFVGLIVLSSFSMNLSDNARQAVQASDSAIIKLASGYIPLVGHIYYLVSSD